MDIGSRNPYPGNPMLHGRVYQAPSLVVSHSSDICSETLCVGTEGNSTNSRIVCRGSISTVDDEWEICLLSDMKEFPQEIVVHIGMTTSCHIWTIEFK